MGRTFLTRPGFAMDTKFRRSPRDGTQLLRPAAILDAQTSWASYPVSFLANWNRPMTRRTASRRWKICPIAA